LAIFLLLGATKAWALTEDEFIQKGKRVVALAEGVGLSTAEKIYQDPKNGFLALDGPGLHVWAANALGVVIFDLSGQTSPGTDLSQWANEDGVRLMESISKVINSRQGGLLAHFKGIPHPRTNRLGSADFWCGRLGDGTIVCATFWPDGRTGT